MGLFDFLGFGDEEDNNSENNTVSTEGQPNTQNSVDGEENTVTEEVPIVNLDEAIAFGMRELGKQRRKSSHKIELKVIGHSDFRVGEWCHVFLPTYNEDCFMFISKVNNEAGADTEFINSLTLVDYPPSLGAGKLNSGGSSDSTSSDSGEDDTKSETALKQESNLGGLSSANNDEGSS